MTTLFCSTMAESNKRKKAAYFGKCGGKKSRTQYYTLHPGLKGFLATCNFREKECVKEAINILSEFADKIYGEEKCTVDAQPKNKKIVFKDSDSESEGEDDGNIESALVREVNALKEERKGNPNRRRFQVVESGADNCVFIRSTVEDPVAIVESILKEIESLSKQKTRFLLRLLPIEVTCKAWPDDIKRASGPLFDKHFKGEPKTFCIVYKRRNNNNVLREELITDIAGDIKMRNPLHRADMKQPELTVIVEVIRNMCCMSVVPKYYHYRKYNLLEVAKMNTASKKPLELQDQTPDTHSTEDQANSQDRHCQTKTTDQEDSMIEEDVKPVPEGCQLEVQRAVDNVVVTNTTDQEDSMIEENIKPVPEGCQLEVQSAVDTSVVDGAVMENSEKTADAPLAVSAPSS